MKVVKFETRYGMKDGEMKAVDWVELAPAGASFGSTRTWVRVAELIPPEHLRTVQPAEIEQLSDFEARLALRWQIIGPAYEAYKRSEDMPESGTPLAVWPGVTSAQAEVLRGMGYRTVEDVAAMDDRTVGGLKWPNARSLPETAKAYLGGQDVAAKDAEIATMKERMAAMEEMLETKLTKDGKVDGRTKAARAQKDDAA